ncbi:MAG: hypothetical protein RIR26_1591 [Pseudomonadota bacterium]|jgi:hypothetical protein
MDEVKIGYCGVVDAGLVAFLTDFERNEAGLIGERQARPHIMPCQRNVLESLESGALDLAVVSLDEILFHTLNVPHSQVRILGCLFVGDCRALVSLSTSRESRAPRILGAAQPDAAISKWEEISCAFDLSCDADVAEAVPPCHLEREMLAGRFALLELNSYWEGLAGMRRGLIRSAVKSDDFGLPKSYSHILVVNHSFLKSQEAWLRQLQGKLSRFYSSALNDADRLAEQLVRAQAFACRPDFGFVRASLRILAPHFESFIHSRGRLGVQDLVPYLRWFQARVLQKTGTSISAPAVLQIDSLLCDVWD